MPTRIDPRPLYPERLRPLEVQGYHVLARHAGGHTYAANVVLEAMYSTRSRVLRRFLERAAARAEGCPRCWSEEEAAVAIRQDLLPRFHLWREVVTWIHAPRTGLDCRECEKHPEGQDLEEVRR